jgi:hypothetical protein
MLVARVLFVTKLVISDYFKLEVQRMKFAEYMETFGAVRNSFQGLSNTTMHIKKSKNGVKRERRLLKERTFKIEAKRYPLDSENIEVLKSLRG